MRITENGTVQTTATKKVDGEATINTMVAVDTRKKTCCSKDILMMQWNTLTDQVEKINGGHWKVFSILVAAFGLASLSDGPQIAGIPVFIWLLPILVMVVLFYEAYILHELSIKIGYLDLIETAINEISGKTNHNQNDPKIVEQPIKWFSGYYIVYSSGKNQAKRLIYLPVIFAVLFTFLLCFIYLFEHWRELNWMVIAIYISILEFTCFADGWAIWNIKESEQVKRKVRANDLTKEEIETNWMTQ